MSKFTAFLIFALLCVSAFAQKSDEILATANNRSFTIRDLAPEVQEFWQNQPKAIAEARSQMLSQMIAAALFEAEAKASNATAAKLKENLYAKIPNPPDAEILKVYEANRQVFGDKTLAQVRRQIVSFLRSAPENKALQDQLDALQTKYKVAFGKDVNAADLKPLDALFTVGGKTISAREFDEKNKFALYDLRAQIFDVVSENLKGKVASELLEAEAAALQIAASDIIRREVTDRLRAYTEEERTALQNALNERLFAKYKAQFLVKAPAPPIENISTDDDPAVGKPNAPVTIVMFSDFQCPTCAAAHPVLKKTAAEFGDKVRFVVRDFPLEEVHENAFAAALAAKAAFNQGKFYEYSEKLYANQNALDADSLRKYAADAGLNLKQFEIDLTDESTAAEVRKDMADGEKYGIRGTPTVFVNGVRQRKLSAGDLRAAIEKALAK